MSKKQRRLEKKRQRALWYFFDDGIWDVGIGLAVIWLGVIVLMRWPAWLAVMALLSGGVIYVLKQRLTVPRLSQVKVPQRKRRAIFEMAGIVIVVLVGMVWLLKDEPGLAGFFAYFGAHPLIMSGIFGGVIAFYLAYALAYPRLYLHGFLLFLGFFLDAWLFPERPVGIAIGAGVIIFVSGLTVMLQFLREYR